MKLGLTIVQEAGFVEESQINEIRETNVPNVRQALAFRIKRPIYLRNERNHDPGFPGEICKSQNLIRECWLASLLIQYLQIVDNGNRPPLRPG